MELLRRIVTVALVSAAVLPARAAVENSAVAEKAAELPQIARSADGFVCVVAADDPSDPVGFRLPILRFAADEVRQLVQAYRLPHARRAAPGLVIHALDGRTNDVRVIVRRETRRDGSRLTRLLLPSPGFTDLDELRLQIAAAALPTSAPPWLVQGALRAADPEMARRDVCFVTRLWLDGRLPYFPALCTDLRRCSGDAAALPGYLVFWMRERKLFAPMMARLEAGEPWDGRRLAEELTGETDPERQDRACDERFLLLLRRVFSPGRSHPFDHEVFSSRLLIYPLIFDKKFSRGRDLLTFREAMDECDDLHVRLAAGVKGQTLPYLAMGRGEGLQAAARAYADFLLGVARGGKKEELVKVLAAADAKLLESYEKSREDDNGQR